MTSWQVQADMADGGQMWFGVQADDRETAQAEARQVLEGLDLADMQVREIPLPGERELS